MTNPTLRSRAIMVFRSLNIGVVIARKSSSVSAGSSKLGLMHLWPTIPKGDVTARVELALNWAYESRDSCVIVHAGMLEVSILLMIFFNCSSKQQPVGVSMFLSQNYLYTSCSVSAATAMQKKKIHQKAKRRLTLVVVSIGGGLYHPS